jgi:uncharacterized membrane protein YbaN (DUF454 family)
MSLYFRRLPKGTQIADRKVNTRIARIPMLRKALYTVVAAVCLVLAAIGMLIPVVPGILFLVLALGAASMVSPRIARAIDRNPLAREWRNRWRLGAGLPWHARARLMFWLTADAVLGRRGSSRV